MMPTLSVICWRRKFLCNKEMLKSPEGKNILSFERFEEFQWNF